MGKEGNIDEWGQPRFTMSVYICILLYEENTENLHTTISVYPAGAKKIIR